MAASGFRTDACFTITFFVEVNIFNLFNFSNWHGTVVAHLKVFCNTLLIPAVALVICLTDVIVRLLRHFFHELALHRDIDTQFFFVFILLLTLHNFFIEFNFLTVNIFDMNNSFTFAIVILMSMINCDYNFFLFLLWFYVKAFEQIIRVKL